MHTTSLKRDLFNIALFSVPIISIVAVSFAVLPTHAHANETPQFTPVSLPPSTAAYDITTGADGNLWATAIATGSTRAAIVRITPDGLTTTFPIPSAAGCSNCYWFGDYDSITTGPEGNVWFTELDGSGETFHNNIGRITPQGTITEFALPENPADGVYPYAITAGPDGNLWFGVVSWNWPNVDAKIGRITTPTRSKPSTRPAMSPRRQTPQVQRLFLLPPTSSPTPGSNRSFQVGPTGVTPPP